MARSKGAKDQKRICALIGSNIKLPNDLLLNKKRLMRNLSLKPIPEILALLPKKID